MKLNHLSAQGIPGKELVGEMHQDMEVQQHADIKGINREAVFPVLSILKVDRCLLYEGFQKEDLPM